MTPHLQSLRLGDLQFDCLECMAQYVESLDPNSGVDDAYKAKWAKQKREAEKGEDNHGKHRLSTTQIKLNQSMKNGSRGTVLSLSEEEVKARFANGKEIAFKPKPQKKKYPYTSDGDGVRVPAEDFHRLTTELGWEDRPARDIMAEYMRRSDEEDGVEPGTGRKQLDLSQPPMMLVSMDDMPLEQAEELTSTLRAKGHNATLFDPSQNRIKDLPDKLLEEISHVIVPNKRTPHCNEYAVVFEGMDWDAQVNDILDAFQYDAFRVEGDKIVPSDAHSAALARNQRFLCEARYQKQQQIRQNDTDPANRC